MVVTNDVFDRVREFTRRRMSPPTVGWIFILANSASVSLPGLLRMYSGTASLPMSCKQRAGEKCLQLLATDLEKFAHLGGVNLSAANVAMSRLVLRIDRDGQRLDRVHVNGGHLLDVLALFGFCSSHFVKPLLVEPVEQMNQAGDQQTEKNERKCRRIESPNRKEPQKQRLQPEWSRSRRYFPAREARAVCRQRC